VSRFVERDEVGGKRRERGGSIVSAEPVESRSECDDDSVGSVGLTNTSGLSESGKGRERGGTQETDCSREIIRGDAGRTGCDGGRRESNRRVMPGWETGEGVSMAEDVLARE